MLDARAEDVGVAVGLPLHEAVGVDVPEEEVGLVEQAVEAAVVIEVGVREDRSLEVEPRGEAAEAPAQEAEHVVAGAGVDQEQLVVRRNHQTAVALADVDEHQFQEALGLQAGRRHEAVAAARVHGNEAALGVARDLDPVAPQQLFQDLRLGRSRLEHEGRWKACITNLGCHDASRRT